MRANLFTSYKSNGILYYLIPVAVFCFWLFIYRYTMMNQELFSVFYFSADFFTGHITRGGGLSEYAGLFIVQLFRYPWIGALFQTGAFVAVYFFTSRFARHTGLLARWSGVLYLPAFTLLGLQMQYEFLYSETLKAVCYFALAYAYTQIAAPRIRLAASLAGAPLFLMLLGGGILIQLYILLAIYELCFAPKRIPYAGMAGWLILVPVLPQVYRQFHLFTSDALYGLFPALTEISFPLLENLLFLWLPAFLLIGWAVRKYAPELLSTGKKARLLLNLLIIAGAAWTLKATCYYPRVEQLFHMDNATAHENWDEVLRTAKDYKGTRNSAIVLTNVALAEKGLLAEDLFKYRQIGIDGLMHPWEINYFNHLYGHEAFYRMGELNEALRWAFEAAVSKSTSTPPHLTKRIAEILIQLEKYEAARKYLYCLLQTWHYSDWARKTLRALPPRAIPSPPSAAADFFFGSLGPFYDLVSMSKNKPANDMIRDYLLCGLLLEKQTEDFYTFFCQYFRPGSMGKLPKVYEEALILVFLQNIDKAVLTKYPITNATAQKFQTFSDALKLYKGSDPDTPARLQPQYGDTYWFYYYFNPASGQ